MSTLSQENDCGPARGARTWKAAVVEGERGSAEMSVEDMGDSSSAPREEDTSSEGAGDLSVAAAAAEVGLGSSMASPIVTERVRLRICATRPSLSV